MNTFLNILEYSLGNQWKQRGRRIHTIFLRYNQRFDDELNVREWKEVRYIKDDLFFLEQMDGSSIYDVRKVKRTD